MPVTPQHSYRSSAKYSPRYTQSPASTSGYCASASSCDEDEDDLDISSDLYEWSYSQPQYSSYHSYHATTRTTYRVKTSHVHRRTSSHPVPKSIATGLETMSTTISGLIRSASSPQVPHLKSRSQGSSRATSPKREIISHSPVLVPEAVIALSQQLSKPIDYITKFTFFAAVAMMALSALVTVLCASYGLSIWDDVGVRTYDARKRIGSGVAWGKEVAGSIAAGVVAANSKQKKSKSSSSSGPSFINPFAVSSLARILPIPKVWSSPLKTSRSSSESSTTSTTTEDDFSDPPRKHRPSLPPRPPLSILLPSIALALLLTTIKFSTSLWTTEDKTQKRRSKGKSRQL